ncbi:HXXXD-type acyl-transferase family protein [Forsythia ovata]|uniref:HXXXD-type acyl-transferase family protein n=1 Tax=Forsythia ovata TaxID=205694 RepID=A0ABD1TP48_9LAMI
MVVNCCHRLVPKLETILQFRAFQHTHQPATYWLRIFRWCAEQLNKNVLAHDNNTVRKYIGDWERDPRCFSLENFDVTIITMGSSPRFPMYENDFGWEKPFAVQNGRANKFDGGECRPEVIRLFFFVNRIIQQVESR